jgi:hypothetical protein
MASPLSVSNIAQQHRTPWVEPGAMTWRVIAIAGSLVNAHRARNPIKGVRFTVAEEQVLT